MAQARYDSHKYSRLNNQEHGAKNRFTDNDDENEEIVLDNENRLRYNSHGTEDDDDHPSHKNGYSNHPISETASHRSSSGGGGMVPATPGVTLRDRLNDSRLMQMAIWSLLTILLYLFLSICLTFYQKDINQQLNAPLTIVSYHLVVKLMMAFSARALYKAVVGKSRIQLDWRSSVRKMAPTGLASGIDIGFSNWGLKLVSISLYTMTKSSTIVFILIFAIMLGLEKKSWSLVFVVSLIAAGLFMFTYKSTQFHALGFIFILVASLSGGVRWSLAQFVMQKSKLGLHNPIDMIYYMQPWMITSLLPLAIIFEGKMLLHVFDKWNEYDSADIYMVILKISIGACLAFCMEVSEFLVLSKTSSLTLSIAGIFKDIVQLALAVVYNGDQLSLVNALGLVVCLAGICCHIVQKYKMLNKNEELDSPGDDDSFDLHYNEASLNGPTSGHNNSLQLNDSTNFALNATKKHSSLTVPLLEETDSDDDDADGMPNKDNSSDVIFDILKRRDLQR